MSDGRIAAGVWALGGRLHARVRRFFDAPLGPDARPLELREALLDDAERQVLTTDGRRTFPFTRVVARVVASGDARAETERVFRDFEARLRARLAELGCVLPLGLRAEVTVIRKAPAAWHAGRLFAIEYLEPRDARPNGRPPVLLLTVLSGAAAQQAFTIESATVLVGRGAEPVDATGCVRRNHVIFAETGDAVSETVGRAHARFVWDAAAAEYRVYDEGSSNGTQVVRDGASITVPARDPRGVRVRTGDEVQFGRARVRVRVRAPGPA